MRREHIRIALSEASKLGPHKEFVVVGSLSVLGLKETPPEMMSMSIDIDFFPFHDQSHIHDIAEELGEDSAFHEAHGYFLDPIAADVLVLPTGWMERMVLHEFGELRVYFLDVNDTAVSKYVRSADNDFRWLDAGLQSGLLDIDKIDGRSQFGVDYPGDDDRRRIRNGIAAHRAAMRNSGSLRMELLEALRSRPDACIATTVNTEGVMGKGLALQFKQAYPAMFRAYEAASRRARCSWARSIFTISVVWWAGRAGSLISPPKGIGSRKATSRISSRACRT